MTDDSDTNPHPLRMPAQLMQKTGEQFTVQEDRRAAARLYARRRGSAAED